VRRPNAVTWVVAALATALHALVGLVFYAASGLVAPLWAVMLLGGWWVGLAVVLIRLARRGSWWTPAVPVVGFGTWWAALTAGEQWLGWTA
jgi:hypothetical protein